MSETSDTRSEPDSHQAPAGTAGLSTPGPFPGGTRPGLPPEVARKIPLLVEEAVLGPDAGTVPFSTRRLLWSPGGILQARHLMVEAELDTLVHEGKDPGEAFSVVLGRHLPGGGSPILQVATQPVVREVTLGESGGTEISVELGPDGVTWVTSHYTEEEDEITGNRRVITSRRRVIAGYFEPLERLDVDGELFFRVRLGREQIVTAESLKKQLARAGRVVASGHAADALSAVLNDLTPVSRTGHAAIGIYVEEADQLVLCTTPIPILPEQERAARECASAIGYMSTVSAADVIAYIRFNAFLHPYEVLVKMGLAAMAPVAYELRKLRVVVASPVSTSDCRDLGKTSSDLAYTTRLYGRGDVDANSIATDFRLAVHYDGAGLPFCVNEAAQLDERHFGQGIKSRAESPDAGQRGTPEQGMVRYRSRGVPFLNANAMPFTS